LFISTCSVIRAEWVPFELKRGHITIDIEFNGEPARAMFDSGAEFNGVSNFYVTTYNDGIHESGQVIVKGISSKLKRKVYSNIPVKLFGQDVTFNKMPAVGLGGSAIMLGAPFFRQFIIQIDYPNSRIQLLRKNSVDMRKFENVNIKKQRGTLLPAIQVKVNDKNVWLTLDTGNSGGLVMKRSYAIENKWITSNEELKKGHAKGVNTAIQVESFNIPELVIGPYTLENIPVIIPAEGEKSNIGTRAGTLNSTPGFSRIGKRGKQTRGLLGYDILKHFVVTIDYKSYKVHIGVP